MKKVKISLAVIVLLTIGIFIGGCENKITPANLQAMAAQQQVLQTQVDQAQALAAQLAADMQAAGVVDPNLSVKIAAINQQADKWQEQANSIGTAITQVKLTGDTNLDWLAMIQAANTASAPVNPYAVPVGAGLSLLSLILGWIAKRKADEAAAAQAKYQAHKQGVELTMKEVSASTDESVRAVETQLYNNIGDARVKNGL